MITIAKTYRSMVLIAILLLSAVLVGCTREDLEQCVTDNTENVVYLKIINKDGSDITGKGVVTTADLYIFDSNGKFAEKVTLSEEQIKQRVPVTIKNGNTVSAWANLGYGQEVSQMNNASTLDNSTIKLVAGPNDSYMITPDDIFFGITRPTTKNNSYATTEIIVSRKVSHMHITLRGIPEGERAENFQFLIDQKNNGYDFNGIPTQKNVTTKKAGEFNLRNDLVTPTAFNLIHSSGAGNGVSVRVIETSGAELVVVDKDELNRPIIPLAGETINILIDISGVEPNVRIAITDWNEIYQWVEV